MGVGNSFKGFETIFAAIRMFFQMLIRLFAVVLLLQICIVGSIIYFNHDKLFGKIDSTDICLFRTLSPGASKCTGRGHFKVCHPVILGIYYSASDFVLVSL